MKIIQFEICKKFDSNKLEKDRNYIVNHCPNCKSKTVYTLDLLIFDDRPYRLSGRHLFYFCISCLQRFYYYYDKKMVLFDEPIKIWPLKLLLTLRKLIKKSEKYDSNLQKKRYKIF